MPTQLWDKTYIGEITHVEWLRRHAGEYTVEEIMAILNRSKSSVDSKLKREGLAAKSEETTPANEVCGIPRDDLLAEIKDKPRSLDELSHKFDRSTDTIRRAMEQLEAMSYEITQTEQQRHVWSTQIPKIVAPPTILWDKDVWEFALGVTSDWHDGSKGAQISARNRAIQIMYDYGVRDIIVPGDISAGRNVYRGQHLDVVSMEADDQVAITNAYCPKMDGLRYHMMGGNHDYSHIREGGYNALKDLCKKRDDFLYYGYDLVTMPLTEEVDALVWHPTGSQAYAMSYRSQKMVEQVAFEQLMEVIKKNATPKVRFLFVGHWHGILMGYCKGPIWIQHPGAFEGQTNLSKRMGVFPEIAGVILEGKITKDRNIIRELNMRPLRFTEIDDDYLNYPVPREEREIETLFKWKNDETD